MIRLWPVFLFVPNLAYGSVQESPEAALARKCDSQIAWITDGSVLVDGSTKPPESPPVDRKELLEQAKRLGREKNRLVLWYCPRVPGTHMMRAALLDTYAKAAFFTDPGIVDLVQAKFIPLRMACDESISSTIGRKFDFVEPGFLVISHRGEILHTIDRIRTFNADWLRGVLVAVLRKNAEFNAPLGSTTQDLIRGGDDEAAFENATTDERAAILRHAGKYREVLALSCSLLHKGIAHLALGEIEAARGILDKEESPEGRYYRAALEQRTGRDPEGIWKSMVEKHPDSPWAWRAAANLVSGRDSLRQGPMPHQFEDFFLTSPPGLARTTGLPSVDPDATARRAVGFLLRAQQPDGSWNDARYCYGWAAYMIRRRIQEGLLDPKYTSWPDVTLRPNFYVAVTALSAAALLEWRENAPGPIDRALAKAEAYLDDDSRIAIGRCEECFAETFRLLYFTKKGDVTRMNRIVARLARLQDRDGFWGHEYPSAFATAGVVHVLVLSRKAGAELPEALLRRAADALLKTRRDGGRQDYRHEAGKPQSSEKNSAGRTAMCELALHECGHGSLENVAAGVDAYWKHLGKLEAVRVCDNHADEELAGFFFYYDVFHTLEAARALAEPARAEHVRKFRSQVLSLPEIDGSFVDSHELGKSYGTAMALLILGRVRDTAVEQELTVLSPEDRPRKMLNTWLVAESEKLFAERRKALAALKTPVDVRKRQEDLRAKFLEVLGGFPERTPLHPRITGTLQRDGYHIEKVIYEVRPDHHVTANFYLPEGKGPFPGVLFPLGHYDNPKPAEEYQRTCILLAKNGIAALTYDPIGQGERYQLLDPDGKPRARGTSEHTLSDVGALLVGTCSAQYFVWEGIRGLDYLASRPEIDPKRLGCMGNSGGGTMTAYLMALDERVACAVPNCFITSMEKLYATVGPQDGEACLRSLVAAGMGHSDFFLLRAPRPSQLSCPTRDYYDIEGAWSTFREAKQIYAILGHAERMDLFEFDDKHSISKPFREAAVRWMRRWLLGVDDAIVETAGPIEKPEDLQCTSSGHVVREFKERTTYDFTADREKALASKRTVRSREDLEREVRRLIAVPDAIRPATLVVDKGDVARRGYRIRKVVFETDPGIRIPALQFVHEAAKETARILYVHGDGKSKEAQPGGAIERLVRAGHTVTAIDLRGMGETEPEPPHRGLVNFVKADWKEAYISFNMSRPLLGQRVRDLLSVAAALIEDGSGIQVMAVGAAAPVALHAAFLDPRLRSVTLEGMVVSWSAVARTPVTINQLTNVVPCALEVYDLPDLAAALAPRPLTIRSAADPAGSPVARGVLGETYQAARSAYADRGVPSALVLEDGGLDR